MLSGYVGRYRIAGDYRRFVLYFLILLWFTIHHGTTNIDISVFFS